MPPPQGFYTPPMPIIDGKRQDQKISDDKTSIKKPKKEKDRSEASSENDDINRYEDTIPNLIEPYAHHPRLVPPGFDFLPPNMPPHPIPFIYDQ